jgi:hypothetical protein
MGPSFARSGCRRSAWRRRVSRALLAAAALSTVVAPAGTHGLAGVAPGPWVHDVILSAAERRELDERRAALEARAQVLADELGECGDLRARVRRGLSGVQQVRSVEVGLVLMTSYPPRMPVTFSIALGSGRLVWDRLTVIVPVRATVRPLGSAMGDLTPSCSSPRS